MGSIMHRAALTVTDEIQNAGIALQWYDFDCPCCYVAQHRNAILVRHGLDVVELPFQPHPDIPPGGVAAGPRNGAMYCMLEREAIGPDCRCIGLRSTQYAPGL